MAGHMFEQVCPKLFAKEITYWGFDIEEVQPCCFPALMHFLWEQDKLTRFQVTTQNTGLTTTSIVTEQPLPLKCSCLP
jgi:hypothetical protein